MRNKLAVFAIFAVIFSSSLCLSAQTPQNEKVGRWQVKHLKNSNVSSKEKDTSPIYSDEYSFNDCLVLFRRDKSGVRIVTRDFEWHKGEEIKGIAREKIHGLSQLIDITKEEGGLVKIWIQFSAFVELLEDYGLQSDGTAFLPRGIFVTELLVEAEVVNGRIYFKYGKQGEEGEDDIFYHRYREVAKELPQEVRAAFFGYAGIK